MRNISFLVHSTHIYLPMKMEQTESSETSVHKLQTPGYYPKESIQHTEHGESLKTSFYVFFISKAHIPLTLSEKNWTAQTEEKGKECERSEFNISISSPHIRGARSSF